MSEAVRVLAEVDSIAASEFAVHLKDFVQNISPPDDPDVATWKEEWEHRAGTEFIPSLEQTCREMNSMLRMAADRRIPFQRLLAMLGCLKPETKGSGTSCVAAAVGAYFRFQTDYKSGVLEIVNTPGIDTDTIASMYGCLVGVRIGSTKIPDRWATAVQDYEYFISAAHALARIALRTCSENELRVDVSLIRRRESPNVLELARDRTIDKNRRVLHDLLGPGWVQSVSEQKIKSGGLMLLAEVALDSGQTVKFRSFRGGQHPRQRTERTRVAEDGQPYLL